MNVGGVDLQWFCGESHNPRTDLSIPLISRNYVYACDGKIMLRLDLSELHIDATEDNNPDLYNRVRYPEDKIEVMISEGEGADWQCVGDIEKILRPHMKGSSYSSYVNFERFRAFDGESEVECPYCVDGCDDCDGTRSLKYCDTDEYSRKYHRSIDFNGIYVALTYLVKVAAVMKTLPGIWQWCQAGPNGEYSPLHFKGPGAYLLVMPKRK